MEGLEAENVRYAGDHSWRPGRGAVEGARSSGPIFDGPSGRLPTARGRGCVWILDAVRQFASTGQQCGDGGEAHDRGVVAVGLGGSEERGPADRFTGVFRGSPGARDCGCCAREARARGRKIGVGRAENWRGAHWATASRRARDAGIKSASARAGHPLEICLTSNLSPWCKSLEEHPLRRLYDAGVPIILTRTTGHVRLHADGRIPAGGVAVRFSDPDAPELRRTVPVRVPVSSPG